MATQRDDDIADEDSDCDYDSHNDDSCLRRHTQCLQSYVAKFDVAGHALIFRLTRSVRACTPLALMSIHMTLPPHPFFY